MSTAGTDVVVIGGGLTGIATAYYLGRVGIKSVVVERDSVGAHASGFAYGGLGSLGGAGIPGPTFAVATEGMRLHKQLAKILPEETGINFDFRDRPSLSLVFTEEEAEEAKSPLAWQQEQGGYAVRWVGPSEIKSIEPRISDGAIGGVHIQGTHDLEPYRLVLALTQAAEKLGVMIKYGQVTGLKRDGDRVRGVALQEGEIACEHAVLAAGPWCGQASEWLGVALPVRPLKGQILRLRAPGPPYLCSIGWGGNYAVTKPDGLVWAGTTEEEAGFDEEPTGEARERIMADLVKKVPALADAQLVLQTACLRPMTPDKLLLLGKVPNCEGMYIATGGGRQGILLGPAMGRITADLISNGSTSIPIDAFDPGRFA